MSSDSSWNRLQEKKKQRSFAIYVSNLLVKHRHWSATQWYQYYKQIISESDASYRFDPRSAALLRALYDWSCTASLNRLPCYDQWCGVRSSVLGQDRSETKKKSVLVLILQVWCCVVKHNLIPRLHSDLRCSADNAVCSGITAGSLITRYQWSVTDATLPILSIQDIGAVVE